MERRHPRIKTLAQGKRTFTGPDDDVRTSKYMRSYKYWLELCCTEGYKAINTFRTLGDLNAFIEKTRKQAGKLM